MGSAESKNISDAVANITSDLANSVSATQEDLKYFSAKINIDRCYIEKDVKIEVMAENYSKAKQLIKSTQDASVQNDITQKLLQIAEASVGSAGIGAASAHNAASTVTNLSNAITNSVHGSVTSISDSVISFNCNRSYVGGSLFINIGNLNKHLVDQTVSSKAVQKAINKLTQDISQKAISKVEGLAGFLIALAVLFVAIGWTFTRPLQVAMENRYIAILIVLIIISLITLAMFARGTPPFFNSPTECQVSNAFGCSTSDKCINGKSGSNKLKSAPLQYTFDIFSTNPDNPGMTQMAILRNQGWTKGNKISVTVDGKKYPLVVEDRDDDDDPIYITNNAIKSISNKTSLRRELGKLINLDTRYFTPGDNTCKGSNCYKFTPDTTWSNQALKIRSGGTLTGKFGVCDSKMYKANLFMQRAGKWIILLTVIWSCLAILLYKKQKKGTSGPSGARVKAK
jgi:hypothetical protein